MKKLTLLFTAIFASAMMFAQVGNVSTIDQSTNWSQVAVDQDGNDNTSEVTQQYGQYHEAIIDQIGDDNVSTLLQDNTNTYTKLYQEGDDNNSEIFQRSRLFVGPGNVASYISLDQLGDDNDAFIHQDAEAGAGGTKTNWAEAIQDGDANTLDIWQYHPGNIAAFNEAGVHVMGDENLTDIFQNGDGNKGSIWSVGDYNDFYQTQIGDMNSTRIESGGDDNYADIDQMGYKNKAYLNQRGTGTGTFGRPITSHDSDDNDVVVYQSGSENLFSGYVAGDDNDVDVSQYGAFNTIGTGMWAADGVNVWGDHNDVDVMQTGTSNSATVNVTGSWNTSSTIQH